MAKIAELDQAQWKRWVRSRPKAVRELCKRLPPDRLYSLKPNGQRVTIISYAEDGTVRVSVSGQYNFVTFDRQVFGINPDDLTECDLPPSDEIIGTALTEEADISAFVDEIRPHVLAAKEDSLT